MNFLTDNFYVIQSKIPMEENDNMLLRLMNFVIDDESYERLLTEDPYLKFKHDRFSDFNVSPEGFSDFKEKTSFINPPKFRLNPLLAKAKALSISMVDR